MPTKKRKAEETEGTPRKKSKEQQVAEARARAKRWHRERAAKKAKTQPATDKDPEPDPHTTSPSTMKKPPAKRRRMDNSKPSPSVSASKPKTKKQLKREEDRKRARAAFASSKSFNTPLEEDVQAPIATGDLTPVAPSASTVASTGSQEPQTLPAELTPPPFASVPVPTPHVVSNPVLPTPRAEPIAVLPTPPTAKAPSTAQHLFSGFEGEEEESTFTDAKETFDEEVESEDALQNEISKQVIENALAIQAPAPLHGSVAQPQVYVQQPKQPQYYSPEPSEQRQAYQASPEKDHGEMMTPPRTWCLLTTVSVLMLAVACIAAHMWISSGADETFVKWNSKERLAPCFISNAPEVLGENGEPLAMVDCDPHSVQIGCPDGGICQNGLLRACADPRFGVAETRDACVLSERSNATFLLIEQSLVDWTIEDKCGLTDLFARKSSSMAPVFPLSKLQEQANLEGVDSEFIGLSSDFHVDDEEGQITFVGLSNDYMENKLVLPVMCSGFLLVFAAISAFLEMAFGWLGFGTGVVWKLTMVNPYVSLVCLATLLFLRHQRRKREESERLIRDIANVRELAYEKMMDDPGEGQVVLHLRDEIAYELHPTSKTGRRYINLKVWKHVVGEVRLDNRVEKTERMLQGRPRDVWRWVAARRQPRVSFG